jgi:hypothetical protein
MGESRDNLPVMAKKDRNVLVIINTTLILQTLLSIFYRVSLSYAERMVRMCESQNATIALMGKQLAEKDELLKKRKKPTRGKRVQLDGVSIYTTAEVLRIAREAETTTVAKKRTKRQRKEKTPELSTKEEDDDFDNSFDVFS